MDKHYKSLIAALVTATAILCAAFYMTGCTATTVRTATAAPDKSGATVTTTKSETEVRMADDTKLLDQLGAFVVGLF